ncbi:E3 ubiquitin-protein ligase CHFR-like isoform X2 [Oculina patagonica]
MATNTEAMQWGQLIFTHDSKPPVLISKESVKLGRKEDCDVSFTGSKFVSGHHCTISRDPDGKVWLRDFSTNGSLLNGKKITKDDKTQICHNDQVQIVHRKDHPESDIAFVFQDLKFLREEAALLDNTLEYNNDTEDISEDEQKGVKPNEMGSTSQKRSRSETGHTDEGPELKKKHQEDETLEGKKPDLPAHNSIADTLLCSICQDIFHDCVSLQPCIHSFCAACYSQWMDRSNDCPSCRKKVERISKNHIINNLVEAFLKEHPERRRSEEELREMDSKNKITEDMLKPKRTTRGLFGSPSFIIDDDDDEEDEDDEDEDYSDDSDREDDLVGVAVMPSSLGGLFGFASSRPVPTSCRLCPGYISPATPSCSASTSEGSSTSVTPPDFTCTPGQIHILCQCCIQPMPHSWPDTMTGRVPAQKCSICLKHFCHLLWGCRRASGCQGCLNKFTDFKFGENDLLSIINNNRYESQILKDYLIKESLSEQDLLQRCLLKLNSKEYTTVDGASHDINSSTVLCYRCGLRNFQELAYQFRRDIPRDKLPESVLSRVDCYWGKNCRTQKTKPLHASRFNHICEQTRF